MSFRERLEWMVRVGLIIFVLAAAAFLSAITTIRMAIRGREVAMPAVVGMKLADAQKELSGKGLGIKIADRVYDAAPAGNVIRQSPSTGMEMKVSQDAHVVVSLGPLHVTIPVLEGGSLRAARVALLQKGLQLGEVSAPYLANTTADAVLIQTPKPGSQASSAHVDLLASLGSRPSAFVMPFLIGVSAPDAEREFSQAGVHNIHLTTVPAPQWPAGTVMDQNPPAGARLASGDFIELKVAARSTQDIPFPKQPL
jgi:eukaryotic-like serine/threonine-protein kinase